jgi:hypothetical protein
MLSCPTCRWCGRRDAAILLTGYPTCGRCYFARTRRRSPAMTLLVGGAGSTRTGAREQPRGPRGRPREVA